MLKPPKLAAEKFQSNNFLMKFASNLSLIPKLTIFNEVSANKFLTLVKLIIIIKIFLMCK
jgi:hypothetical protein